MSSRYDGKRVFVNDSEIYKEAFINRGINSIKHYETMKLRYPTVEEIQQLQLVGHIWQHGDRLWKLASKYYGDPTLWYIIGWFNKKPTDYHIKAGNLVYIPFSLSLIKKYLGL